MITRSDQVISSIKVDPPLLSDHSLIVVSTDLYQPQRYTYSRQLRRNWRSLDVEGFAAELRQSALMTSPPSDVDELFQCYDNTLRSLADVHAPLKIISCRSGGRSARWFDGECRSEKAKTRRLEKQYRRCPTVMAKNRWSQQFGRLRKLLKRKAQTYWSTAISSCDGDPKAMWTKINALLTPPSSDSPKQISAEEFALFFNQKVDSIRLATSTAAKPEIQPRASTNCLSSFKPVTPEEICQLLKSVPAKHCSLDPVPTWLIKRLVDDITPIITNLCNRSIQSCHLPTSQKTAVVHPRVKKPTLDPSQPSSYRPISNLSFLSKIIERVVAARYTEHAERQSLFPERQSAYRRHHSTETVVVSVMNDVIRAADEGKITCLVLLDLTAAFDTVDHGILTDVLRNRFSVEGDALEWFGSYLSDRTQVFVTHSQSSSTFPVTSSVPQGSVLGPVKFISYSEDITIIFRSHNVSHHLFADDKQLLESVTVAEVDKAVRKLQSCITDVQTWCASRRLQLNAAKTEVIWLGTRQRLQQLADTDLSLTVGSDTIKPSAVVRDLGVLIDAELTMHQHVSRLVSSCFYQLRRLRTVRKYVGHEVLKQLVHAFVISRLDYCNSVLAGLPGYVIARLQRVQNAAARLVLGLRPYDHVTEALRALHWLPVKYRVRYKLCLMMHSVHIQQCPSYINQMVQSVSTSSRRQGLRSSADASYLVPRTRTKFADRAFSVAGPQEWNSLPTDLRLITDTSVFKSQLKTYFFNLAFNQV